MLELIFVLKVKQTLDVLFESIKTNLGKILKTGRPANPVPPTPAAPQNVTTTNTSPSAPSQPKAFSPVSLSSSSPNTPAVEARLTMQHPASALGVQQQSSSSKTSTPSVTLKLRREMTQPALSRAELVSTMDASLEKLAANDTFPPQYRTNLTSTKLNLPHQSDLRCKQLRINPSRLSAECFPVRHISRSRVNDRLPSPKGKQIVYLFSLSLSVSFIFYEKNINNFRYLLRLS